MKRRSVLMGLAGLVVWPTPLLANARAIAGPYRLYRKLERELVDGAGLIVERSFAIEFSPHAAGGWLIEGRQTDARVDAPPPLAALARLEQQRDGAGFLPLTLGIDRRILSHEAGASPAPMAEDVIDAAEDFLSKHASNGAARASAREFIAALSREQADWLSHLPRDLFFPSPRSNRIQREIALQDGTKGLIEMREDASATPADGLLHTFRRNAVTTVGESSRRASEIWLLERVVS